MDTMSATRTSYGAHEAAYCIWRDGILARKAIGDEVHHARQVFRVEVEEDGRRYVHEITHTTHE